MKVVHINTTSTGGAALCMFRIHKALLAQGIESRVILATKYPKCDKVDCVGKDPFLWSSDFFVRKWQVLKCRMGHWPESVQYRELIKSVQKKKKIFYTSPVTDYRSLCNHPWIQEADIIHLHWISDFVDFRTFFETVRKPIIWTMHDENPGFGGFHYTPQDETIIKNFARLEDQFCAIKKGAIDKANITLVSISNMMRNFARNNNILKGKPDVLIHNGVDANDFKPFERDFARKALSLDSSKTYFMFASYFLWDTRKGLKQLIQALEELNIHNVELLCVGDTESKMMETSIPYRCFGLVSDTSIMSLIYSAADFFVIPSFQESFGQTPLEAMACGTPVIGFPCGIVPELVNFNNGVITKDFTVQDLKSAIESAKVHKYDRSSIRKYVIENYSLDIIAEQYVQLYKSLL